VYRGEIVHRNAYTPILPDDIRQALITLFSDPARKTSPGNAPKWLGSLIYRCGKCGDGTTLTVRRNKSGTPIYQCPQGGHCAWTAERVDTFVEGVIIARLSRNDVADLIPHEMEADVSALRDELVVCEGRKRDAALMFARRTIDEEQLETISAELDQRMGEIRADLKAATAHSPLSAFAMTDDAKRTWDDLSIGRKREITRNLMTVTLTPLGRGHSFSRDLIQISRSTPAAQAA
jgi:hypothetical protein